MGLARELVWPNPEVPAIPGALRAAETSVLAIPVVPMDPGRIMIIPTIIPVVIPAPPGGNDTDADRGSIQ